GVDLYDGVVAIRLSGEHASELERAHARLGVGELLAALGFDRVGLLSPLGDGELEQLRVVLEVALQLLDRRDLVFDLGALAKERLRLGLIVPKAGRARALVQLVETSLERGKVKDAPLAS